MTFNPLKFSLVALTAVSVGLSQAQVTAATTASPSTFQTALSATPPAVPAETPVADEAYNLHLQTTYVQQHKNSFYAPYTGPQSLVPGAEKSYTWTLTAYLGARLWNGGEFYLDPEVVEGLPLSHLYGLGSINNGEIQKNGGVIPNGYVARLFLRQTWNLGGSEEAAESGANQLATHYRHDRVVMTLGKVAQTDLFEKNSYANDPRSQFLNWALITHGAWDYAADARAYTWGLAGELDWHDWAVRGGRFLEPKVANGLDIDYQFKRFHGDILEVEHDHELAGQPGLVRFMVYHNRAMAGSYRDAVASDALTGGIPDVTAVRKPSTKTGLGISLEQSVTSDLGTFLRASWADDQVEEYAFTEIDNAVSGGLALKGSIWKRPQDTLGLAFSTAGLNNAHRDYLAAGGLGGFLGDGQLAHYGREAVAETYYLCQPMKGVQFTVDYQRIANPGYNADRHGPVNIVGGRFHWEM